jgi:hypothetical protein
MSAGADTAVDALRRRHAEHRTETEARRTKMYGADAVKAMADGGGPSDEDRSRAQEILLGDGDSSFGRGFGLFGMTDLFLLAIMLVGVWLVVKAEHQIDLWDVAWEYIKPGYDEGFFDAGGPADSGFSGEL